MIEEGKQTFHSGIRMGKWPSKEARGPKRYLGNELPNEPFRGSQASERGSERAESGGMIRFSVFPRDRSDCQVAIIKVHRLIIQAAHSEGSFSLSSIRGFSYLGLPSRRRPSQWPRNRGRARRPRPESWEAVSGAKETGDLRHRGAESGETICVLTHIPDR